jgi:outer membrane protein OmpA-like peptidoglycan-associated protein
MKQSRKWIVSCIALLCLVCVGSAIGASDGKKVKINGLITGRDGENLTVKTLKGSTNVVVVLADDTKIQTPKGVFRHQEQAVTALIPGLKIQVEGTGTETRVVAKTINLTQGDLLLAETIQAGLDPTKQQQATNTSNISTNKEDISTNKEGVAANQQQIGSNQAAISANQGDIAANQQEIQATTQRFNELSEYNTTAKAVVYFTTGSSTISASDQAALSALAGTALGTAGYIIQVKGFADSSGNAAMNQQLSMDRAQAVVAYLLQNCSIPLRHIVAPGAMGIADPAAPNETADGRADNRRVDVKVLVNKGVAGGM